MTKTTFSLSIGLARLRVNAIRAVLVLLALAGGLPAPSDAFRPSCGRLQYLCRRQLFVRPCWA